MGIDVKRAKNSHSFQPPPSFQEKYRGTKARRTKRRRLEKFSLPAASAGRGAFLIDGYFRHYQYGPRPQIRDVKVNHRCYTDEPWRLTEVVRTP